MRSREGAATMVSEFILPAGRVTAGRYMDQWSMSARSPLGCLNLVKITGPTRWWGK
jgi:hypothetical protein